MITLVSTKTIAHVMNGFTKGRCQLIPTPILFFSYRSSCARNKRGSKRTPHNNYFNTTASNSVRKPPRYVKSMLLGSLRLTDRNARGQRGSKGKTMRCDGGGC